MRLTPCRPTIPGSDRVTPYSALNARTGNTARSSRSTASAMRAETIPMPNWLA